MEAVYALANEQGGTGKKVDRKLVTRKTFSGTKSLVMKKIYSDDSYGMPLGYLLNAR